MQHIMNDVSRMSRLKQRAGLKLASYSPVTSDYITLIRIQKKMKKIWREIQPKFEEVYSQYKGYDYIMANSIVESLSSVQTPKLLRLESDIDKLGNEGVVNYVLHKMKIDKNNLILKLKS